MLFRKQLNSLRERLQYANSSYYGAVMRSSTGTQQIPPYMSGYPAFPAMSSTEELMKQYESARQTVASSMQ